jgi:predicted regulator of Ras-like GTPase activity (Roadblock/LC7/MglB family)
LFADTLRKVVDNVDGGIAAVIMGLDGIPVESYVRQSDHLDVTTVAMEFSFILSQVRKAGDSLAVGSLEELSV